MNLLSWIEAKRDGAAHTPEQIRKLVSALVEGRLPDYQVAAWLMAVYFRGLDREELRALTLAMRDSGERLMFPDDPRPLADKHSTGGVGDKVSLPLAPLLACLGFRVPMISGRSLGITGGTLDKLESIPGFTTRLSARQIVAQVQELGVAMAGQTERMVPADRILYALRDVTGTVPTIPLLTSSILSKKLAESLDALVLDVKFGRGAFMVNRPDAERLATSLTQLAQDCGVPTRVIMNDMNRPLGRSVGNWLEVKESVECLSGRGPGDLRALVLECAGQLLEMTGKSPTVTAGKERAALVLDSGAALAKWEALLAAQGANLDQYRRQLAQASMAGAIVWVTAPKAGQVNDLDAALIGTALRECGAGRLTQETPIDPTVGLDQLVQVGEEVASGQPLARIHARNTSEANELQNRLKKAFHLTERGIQSIANY